LYHLPVLLDWHLVIEEATDAMTAARLHVIRQFLELDLVEDNVTATFF
jgi:hypothetical protein